MQNLQIGADNIFLVRQASSFNDVSNVGNFCGEPVWCDANSWFNDAKIGKVGIMVWRCECIFESDQCNANSRNEVEDYGLHFCDVGIIIHFFSAVMPSAPVARHFWPSPQLVHTRQPRSTAQASLDEMWITTIESKNRRRVEPSVQFDCTLSLWRCSTVERGERWERNQFSAPFVLMRRWTDGKRDVPNF